MAERRSREQQKAATRSALARSAADVIARRGFHAATVDAIAENAGFSVGALYSNFGNKDSILLAAAEQNQQDWAEQYISFYADGASLDERVRGIAHAWIDGVTTNPEPFLLWIELWVHAVRHEAPLRSELAARSRPVRAAFTTMAYDSARAFGLDLTDDEAAGLAVLADAAGLGMALLRLLDPDAVPPGAFEDISVRWLSSVLQVMAQERSTEPRASP